MIARRAALATAVIAAAGIAVVQSTRASEARAADDFVAMVMTISLDTPWDLAWGPDGMIWVSERGGRISRVDPNNGRRTDAGTVSGVRESGEGGLMGIAFHPGFAREPFVYAVHTYGTLTGSYNKLVRMRLAAHKLGAPETLLDRLPGGGIHNGARIAVGKDGMLYITTGDAGNSGIAQDTTSLGGKVLRLTLDGKPAVDNPFGKGIWTIGHRNGQGLVAHPRTGVLYETEHGPGDNDEVNIIERGRNYGWPDVRGACDENSEREFCRKNRVIEPLTAWTPTVAISGADLYLSNRIRSFENSLLATSLGGSLFRMTLSADGRRITERVQLLAGAYGRLRDVLVAPNGDVWICTSNRDGRGSARDDDDRLIRLSPRR
jgi:glucose/arabinose dehydrogenase